MTPKKGHHVKAKTGKHAGQVGRVHKDMGVVHVYQVHFPGYGLSYQPVANVAPADPPGPNDTPDPPVTAASDFTIQQEADSGLHCVMKGDQKVKCHPTKEAAQVHLEMLMQGDYYSDAAQPDLKVQKIGDMFCVMKDGKRVKCHAEESQAQAQLKLMQEAAKAWEIEMEYVMEAAKDPPNLAPYKIIQKGDKFAVVNNKGETKATFKTRAEALKYQRALYTNVPGAPGKAAKKPWSGDQKRAS